MAGKILDKVACTLTSVENELIKRLLGRVAKNQSPDLPQDDEPDDIDEPDDSDDSDDE